MKKCVQLFFVFIVFVFISCDDPFIRGYEEEALPEYTGDMVWEKVIDKTSFSRRYDHASTVYDNKIWVFGGYDPTRRGNQDTYMEDVWSSADGIRWNLVTEDALWKDDENTPV